MRIKIQNFQRIAKADLLAEGLTVITGPSNRGKSALIRAIQATLFGRSGEDFIRHGETTCLVNLELENDKISWAKSRKSGGSATLNINGTVYSKLGREGPQPHTEKLGYCELKVREQKIRPQFAAQHDSPFLVSESDTVIAELFKVLGRADVVTEAQDNCRKDLKGKQQRKDLRTEDQVLQGKKIESLKDVPRIEAECRTTKDNLNQLESRRRDNKELRDQLEVWVKGREVQQTPDTPELPEMASHFENLEGLQKLSRLTLKEIPIAHEIRDLSAEFLRVADLQQCLDGGGELLQLEKEIGELNGESKSCLEQKLAFERQLGRCPTCGGQFSEQVQVGEGDNTSHDACETSRSADRVQDSGLEL